MRAPSLVLPRTNFGELAAAISLSQVSANDALRVENRGRHHFLDRAGIPRYKKFIHMSVKELAEPETRRRIRIAYYEGGERKHPSTMAEIERGLRILSIHSQIMNPYMREDYFLQKFGDRLRAPQGNVWRDRHSLSRFLNMANDLTNWEFVSRFLTGR